MFKSKTSKTVMPSLAAVYRSVRISNEKQTCLKKIDHCDTEALF